MTEEEQEQLLSLRAVVLALDATIFQAAFKGRLTSDGKARMHYLGTDIAQRTASLKMGLERK